MDYIYDSDPETAPPPVPESAIDFVRLRESYWKLSEETRKGLLLETRASALERVFGILELLPLDKPLLLGVQNHPLDVGTGESAFSVLQSSPTQNQFVEATSIPTTQTIGDQSSETGSLYEDAVSHVQPTFVSALDKELQQVLPPLEDAFDEQKPEKTTQTQTSADIGHSAGSPNQFRIPSSPQPILPSEQSHAEPPESEPQHPLPQSSDVFARPRSLRRRTFASVHPYIADQADYLEICSIESINEMFTAESDLSSVVKTLNHMYLRKKKRYPDEDRYRSANFYRHLGRSKLLALTGDPDAQPENPHMSSSQVSDANFEVEPESEPNPVYPLTDFNIPQSPDILSRLDPDLSSSDDEELGLRSTSRNVVSSHSESGSDSEKLADERNESEQMIRIGGRYRKLSKILKGVLPESARRLSIFKPDAPRKKRKAKSREITPRKGLAQKKFGTRSGQSAELEQELRNSIATEEPEIDALVTPSRTQPRLVDLASKPREPSVSSDPSRWLDSVDYSSFSEESDENDEFSRSGLPSFKSSSFETSLESPHHDSIQRTKYKSPNVNKIRRLSTRGKNSHSPANHKRNPPVKRKRAPTLIKRNFHQARLNIKRISQPIRPQKHAIPEKIADASKKKRKPSLNEDKHHGRFTELDFRRDPNTSTFIYEIESTKKFVSANPSSRPFNQNNFTPTREGLFAENGFESSNPLLSACDFTRPNFLHESVDYLPGEDSVSIVLSHRNFTFGLYLLNDSRSRLITVMKLLFLTIQKTDQVFNEDHMNGISRALIGLMKWLVISQENPSPDLFATLGQTLGLFSKFQRREVNRLQSSIHSQLLFLYWLLLKLEDRHSPHSTDDSHAKDLVKFSEDFWIRFFLSYLVYDVRTAMESSKSSNIYNAVLVLRTIYHSNVSEWWLSISNAISELVMIDNSSDLIDLVYFLASLKPATSFNWSPFLALLKSLGDSLDSNPYHHYINACESAAQRLGWPLEERLFTSFFLSCAHRKFANFENESDTPEVITDVVKSASEISDKTVFDRFLAMVFRYISDLDSEREVKRLISKLLPSSKFVFKSSHRCRTSFVNRVNLVLLLSLISTIDLSLQISSLVELIMDSGDWKIASKASDAIAAFCRIQILKQREVSAGMAVLSLKLSVGSSKARVLANKAIKLISEVCQSLRSPFENMIFLFRIFSMSNIDSISSEGKTRFLGLIVHATQNLELSDNIISERNTIEVFQKNLMSFLSVQMNRANSTNLEHSRSIIEMCIQLWNTSATLLKNRHWNVMMFQKYSYMGNAYLREEFLCFFIQEFLHGNESTLSYDVVVSMDKFFLKPFCAPTVSTYVLNLFCLLSRDSRSIFSLGSSNFEKQTLFSLLANKLLIISAILKNLPHSLKVPYAEREGLVTHLFDSLLEEYRIHSLLPGYAEFCKKVLLTIQTHGMSFIKNVQAFQQFASELGLTKILTLVSWSNLRMSESLTHLNREFSQSLVRNSTPLSSLEPWIHDVKGDALITIIELYALESLRDQNYWCHLSLALEVLLRRLEAFEMPLREIRFLELMNSLIGIGSFSTSSTVFESKCESVCAQIILFGSRAHDGYQEQEEINMLASDFFLSLNGRQVRLELYFSTVRSLDFSLSDLQNRHSDTPMPSQVYRSSLAQITASISESDLIERFSQKTEEIKRSVTSRPNALTIDFQFSF
ncbi:hypothetical protein PUMCH_003481 [Australozyma saopauloensis]|uniref:Telomere-associated protein Rif1 N-terminal domain-containing protein n=1 Tax=Australozyma saopauloensis TaxID=291208 RepID=A0AAX4HCW2_9ASCO|nr:hypothetical protein PUMCH_003481 [[Candida] saopauloensis]